MADYYTNFSVRLELTPDQIEYAMELVKQVEAFRTDNQPLPADFPTDLADVIDDWPFEIKAEKKGVWLHSQYGGQETACAFIQHLLQKFDFAPYVTFEWSHDCNKPRTDAYGGGAAFITHTETETFSTSEWLHKMTC